MTPPAVEHPGALSPGTRIERFEVDAVLAASDASIRYSCRDGDRRFALLECFPAALVRRQDGDLVPHTGTTATAFAALLEELLRDADNAASFRHPGVVPLHRTFRENGTVYAVMDHVEGEALASLLAREGRLPTGLLEPLTNRLLVSLEALHGANLLHLGVDPGEIVVTEEENAVVLASTLVRRSAGGARHAFAEVRQQRHTAFTTSPYAAIELYAKGGQIGPWTDLYGLGATLHHCVTGEAPPAALDRVLHDDLSAVSGAGGDHPHPDILAAIDAALQVQPTERPRTVDRWRIVSQGTSAPVRPGQIGARGGGAAAREGSGSARPRWALAALGLVAVTAVISYLDTGLLRGGDDPDATAAVEVAGSPAESPAETPAQDVAATEAGPATADGAAAPDSPAEESVASADAAAERQTTPEEIEAQPSRDPAGTGDPPGADGVADVGDPAGGRVSDGEGLADAGEAPQPPAPAALLVETVPAGVEVWLAEELVGRTPLQLEGLSPGARDISLRHPLYETIDLPEQEFPAGRQVQIDRRLARATGALLLATEPPGAWISWRGERLADATPATVEGLPAGPLELVIDAPGYVSQTVTVQVPRGDTSEFAWSLERAFGTLTLDLSPPDAQATVLGEDGGAYSAGMALPEGPHRIEVLHPYYRPETAAVTVAGDTRARVALERLQSCALRVRGSPPPASYPLVRTFGGGTRSQGSANILVAFTVQEDGTVAADSLGVDVERSTLDEADALEAFSEAAMDAVRRYRFDFAEGPCTKSQRASLMIRFVAGGDG